MRKSRNSVIESEEEPAGASALHFSSRRDKFRILSVPRDLAAEPVSVLVEDPERLHRAFVPGRNSFGLR
jgi:hypothetical protein